MRTLPPFTLIHSRSAAGVTRTVEAPTTTRVGIWDLGAWVGGMPHVNEALNNSQPLVTFFEIQAAVPAGLRSSAGKLKAFAMRRFRRRLTRSERAHAIDAVLDEDFFPRGEAVRLDLGIDYLIAITSEPLAGVVIPPGERRRTIYYDFFSSNDDAQDGPRTSIVSVDGVRPLAAQANRLFEMVVGYLAVRALFVILKGNKLEFHDDTGCLFDFTDNRAMIVRGLRVPQIEPSCCAKIQPRYRDAAAAMIRALHAYKPPPKQIS